MGLKERQNKRKGADSSKGVSSEKQLLKNFGILKNPFPSASETQGHPHMETEVDDQVGDYFYNYDRDQSTQVIVVEGDQGTGKTNLLNYYENEFKDVYPESKGFFIIRYYADPEPGFEKLLARIIQELGIDFIKKIAKKLNESEEMLKKAVETAKNSDMRTVLGGLAEAAQKDEDTLDMAAIAAKEWILGYRLLKRHREKLGPIDFRLDTVESKTQVLRDLVFCSVEIGILKGFIILLDELEKYDDTTSKMTVLRFLSAIRALIDALPKYLFLMVAITPDAKRRYFEMLPAFAGRLQNNVELSHLKESGDAIKLYNFYLEQAYIKATSETKRPKKTAPVVSEKKALDIYELLENKAGKRGDEGVRQRDYLNELYKKANGKIRNVLN